MSDPRDIAEDAIVGIDLKDLRVILDRWRTDGDTAGTRASLAILVRRVVKEKHVGELEQ